jgi:hypothetical protein
MHTALLSAPDWAQAEFGNVDLQDRRRRDRLLQVAACLSQRPRGTLPQSFTTPCELTAAYRLLETPAVTREAIMAPHFAQVRQACAAPGDYLWVEDTTELDYSTHPAAAELGYIGNGKNRGLLAHSSLVLHIEQWNAQQEPQVTLLGLGALHCWTRPTRRQSTAEKKRSRLRRDRESQRWAAVVAQIGVPPALTRYTFVADREADIWETLERCREHRWDFIVRASQARALAEAEGDVFTAVAAAPVRATFTLKQRSRPARKIRDKRTGRVKRSRPAHTQRTVTLEVRACTATVRAPWRPGDSGDTSGTASGAACGSSGGGGTAQTVNLVEAREVSPQAGVDPIHWVLLTSWPCATPQEALRVVKAYTRRWLIEEYHKALKTGVGMEESQLRTRARLEALLGILAVVAVRLLERKLRATTQPEVLVDARTCDPIWWHILETRLGKPSAGWTQRTLLRGIARLGGFIGRKGDGEPGWLTIWRGWQCLQLMAEGFRLAQGERCG